MPTDSAALEGATAVFLPVEWQVPGRSEGATVAAEALIDAALSTSEPVRISFIIEAGASQPTTAGFCISGIDSESVAAAVDIFARSADALISHQGLGTPVPWSEPPAAPSSYRLERVLDEHAGRRIVNYRSLPWTVAAGLNSRTRLTVTLIENVPDPDSLLVAAQLTVTGEGSDALAVAHLIAADTPGSVRLEPDLHDSNRIDEESIVLPLGMVAHLVATPSRLADTWPAHPPADPNRLTEQLTGAVPPHVAIFGGSGLGKTTLFEHLIGESIAAGNRVIVLDPHGDLAQRAMSKATANKTTARLLDFGSIDQFPTWNLLRPPTGVTRRAWVTEMYTVIRNAWPDSPDSFFGPVGMKALRTALGVLIRDPHGPWPLTELPDALDPDLAFYWADALDRIDDPQLTRDHRWVLDAISSDSQKHTGIWVASKLEPFIADERITRIIGNPRSSFNLDQLSEQQLLAIAAPSAGLGATGANIITSAVLSQIWQKAQRERSETLLDVFIDEAHRMPPSTIQEILQEGRKFGVRLRLTTQSPLQLNAAARAAVLANSGAIGTFRTGHQEAELLATHFPTVTPTLLSQLPNHWVAVAAGRDESIGPTRPPDNSGTEADTPAALLDPPPVPKS